MEDEIKEKIFYAEKDLKDLLCFLRTNNGKRKRQIKRIIYDINDILDYINHVKKEEIYYENSTPNPVTEEEVSNPIFNRDLLEQFENLVGSLNNNTPF